VAGASLRHIAGERALAENQGRCIRASKQHGGAERNGAADAGAAGAVGRGGDGSVGPVAAERLIALERGHGNGGGRVIANVEAAADAVAARLAAAARAAHGRVVGEGGIGDGCGAAGEVLDVAAKGGDARSAATPGACPVAADGLIAAETRIGTDILIAGTTTYNATATAGQNSLMAILAELQSSDTFADKVYDLIHGTNSGDPAPHGHDLNGTNKLTWNGTVHASTGAFTLKGDTSSSSNPDWFFSNSSSTITDFNDDGVHDEHNNNAIGVL
jgi:hypothetical protein